ncbi:MAG: adenylyltransferase/cytidyltransferase family protein [Gemmataceae bacterium]|nr:adenylyltransferase/cytidyltransferase family protein [Gemmataceae bacterium]
MASINKVGSLQEVARTLSAVRAGGKKVILCHGVFDLLHMGHIRYLQRARELGDALVVTVTPDRFVNKGPHRPAFGEEVRAAALAALECVDHVAVNTWPTAVETLRLLKPNIYAKGAEYRDKRTPEIVVEEETVREVGAEIVYIDDFTSSSSQLLNSFLSLYSDETRQYLQQLGEKYKVDQILHYVEAARDLKVLVVGEAIIDEYYYCQTLGKSSKAPILAMQYMSHDRFGGGTLAIANHLAAFCQEVGLVSMLGKQDSDEDWIRKQLKDNVDAVFVRKTDAPTIVKRRYRESYFAQPVFEIYIMNDTPLSDADDARLCARLRERVKHYDLVVVADYGHGMLRPQAVDLLCNDAKVLTINAQANAGNVGYHTISKYRRADYAVMSEQELRLDCRSRTGDLKAMLKDVSGRLSTGRIVCTRGQRGCLGYQPEAGFTEAPALATKLVDRVGAGDAYLSTSALCAAQQSPMDIQMFLGNVAGAEAVATVGNRETLDALRLRRHVESLLK